MTKLTRKPYAKNKLISKFRQCKSIDFLPEIDYQGYTQPKRTNT